MHWHLDTLPSYAFLSSLIQSEVYYSRSALTLELAAQCSSSVAISKIHLTATG